ncbi:AP-4 complex subunit mu [Chlorella vulgaris]
MLSQVFLLSPRGDTLIFKDFKGNVPKTSTETFFRKAKFWDGEGRDAPPAFTVDGVQYLHVKVGGLYWVASTRENVSPSLVLELLLRMYWICRDYFGYVSEEMVRKNFLLVYELLDEIIDYGLPQNSSTERLKQFIMMEPVAVKQRLGGGGRAGLKLPGGATGPTEVIKSVLDTDRTGAKEEIFVDIVEKLTAIFDASGHQKSSSIVGAIQIKSYLSGNPPIRLGLSENLILGRRDSRMQQSSAYGSDTDVVVLDTYSINEGVDAERFDAERVLELAPPDGHFALMNYRSSRSFRPPFRVYPLVEDDMYAGDKLTLYLRLLAEYPASKTASGVEVTVPLPRSVQRVHCETGEQCNAPNESKLLALPGRGVFEQSAEWRERERKLVWSIKNLRGGQEHTLRCRLTVDQGSVESTKRDYGPIMLQFVLPGKPSASGLDVRYMKILKDEKNYAPSRWFRVVAMANSYQIRPH